MLLSLNKETKKHILLLYNSGCYILGETLGIENDILALSKTDENADFIWNQIHVSGLLKTYNLYFMTRMYVE